MNYSHFEENVKQVEDQIGNVVDAVLLRGYDEIAEEFDDYELAITQYEFQKLIIYQLYEVYFTPKRHEFELQLLTDIVEAVAHNKTAAFLGTAVISGMAGNAAYDVSKRLFAYVVMKLRSDKNRARPFGEIEKNLEKIRDYFNSREEERIEDISTALNVEREKLEPLLKLLGFKCKRRKKRQVWIKPNKW